MIFGLRPYEYEAVVADSLADVDISAAMKGAATVGVTEDVARSLLTGEKVVGQIDARRSALNAASKGSVDRLERLRSDIDAIEAQLVKWPRWLRVPRQWSWAIWRVALGLLATTGVARLVRGIVGIDLPGDPWLGIDVFVGVAAIAMALVIGALARPELWWPTALPRRRRMNGLEREASRLVAPVQDVVRDAMGEILRPVLTLAVRRRKDAAVMAAMETERIRRSPVTIDVERAPALNESGDLERLVDTPAFYAIQDLLDSQSTAAIGIAGPRGVGKTTLMRRFSTGSLDGSRNLSDPILGVYVTVPVRYDPRDFALHLFATFCRTTMRIIYDYHGTFGELDPFPQPDIRRIRRFALPVFSIGLSAVAAFVFLQNLLSTGAAVNAAGSIAVVLGLLLLGRPVRLLALLRPYRLLLPSLLPGQTLLVLGVGVLVWNLGSIRTATLVVSGLIFLAGLANFGLWLSRKWTRRVPFSRVRDTDFWVRDTVRDKLHNLRWQQSFGGALSGEVSIPGGIKVKTHREVSTTERQQPLPELIAELHQYIRFVSETLKARVVIGIDELDKISTDAEALGFINDIKDLFQVDGCYFLVSVSESALHSFTRRGLPVRNAFDTAFDQVVTVRYWTTHQSLELIAKRTIDFPSAAALLCHSFAGGLPRDLVRVAREVIELNQSLGRPSTLDDVAMRLVWDDIYQQIDASVATARDQERWDRLDWLLGLSRIVTSLDEDSEGLLKLVAEWRHEIEVSGTQGDAKAYAEMMAFLYYGVTLLQFYANGRSVADWESGIEDGSLIVVAEQLATSRQALAIQPREAWLRVVAARDLAELTA